MENNFGYRIMFNRKDKKFIYKGECNMSVDNNNKAKQANNNEKEREEQQKQSNNTENK